jgi:hypothetical protein
LATALLNPAGDYRTVLTVLAVVFALRLVSRAVGAFCKYALAWCVVRSHRRTASVQRAGVSGLCCCCRCGDGQLDVKACGLRPCHQCVIGWCTFPDSSSLMRLVARAPSERSWQQLELAMETPFNELSAECHATMCDGLRLTAEYARLCLVGGVDRDLAPVLAVAAPWTRWMRLVMSRLPKHRADARFARLAYILYQEAIGGRAVLITPILEAMTLMEWWQDFPGDGARAQWEALHKQAWHRTGEWLRVGPVTIVHGEVRSPASAPWRWELLVRLLSCRGRRASCCVGCHGCWGWCSQRPAVVAALQSVPVASVGIVEAQSRSWWCCPPPSGSHEFNENLTETAMVLWDCVRGDGAPAHEPTAPSSQPMAPAEPRPVIGRSSPPAASPPSGPRRRM